MLFGLFGRKKAVVAQQPKVSESPPKESPEELEKAQAREKALERWKTQVELRMMFENRFGMRAFPRVKNIIYSIREDYVPDPEAKPLVFVETLVQWTLHYRAQLMDRAFKMQEELRRSSDGRNSEALDEYVVLVKKNFWDAHSIASKFFSVNPTYAGYLQELEIGK